MADHMEEPVWSVAARYTVIGLSAGAVAQALWWLATGSLLPLVAGVLFPPALVMCVGLLHAAHRKRQWRDVMACYSLPAFGVEPGDIPGRPPGDGEER